MIVKMGLRHLVMTRNSGDNSILNLCEQCMSSFNLSFQALSNCRSTSTPFLENEIKRVDSIKSFFLEHKYDEDQENNIDYLKAIE